MVMLHYRQCDGIASRSQRGHDEGMITPHLRTADYRPEEGRAPVSLGFATVNEAAHFLRLSRAKIHLMLRAGQIPHARYGRAVRIPWNWLQAQAEGQ